jgi:hypothetical protein
VAVLYLRSTAVLRKIGLMEKKFFLIYEELIGIDTRSEPKGACLLIS